MPLKGTEDMLGAALLSAAARAAGDEKIAWNEIAKALVDHITKNALVTGTSPPGGGPVTDGKVI